MAFSTEIFSKRRKICACMKKAQSVASNWRGYGQLSVANTVLVVREFYKVGPPFTQPSFEYIQDANFVYD